MLRLLNEQCTTTASNTMKYVVQHWNFGLTTFKCKEMLIVHIIVPKGVVFNLVEKSSFFKSQTSTSKKNLGWRVEKSEKSEKTEKFVKWKSELIKFQTNFFIFSKFLKCT